MARPFPFRTVRKAGTPSAVGGNVHTLQGHMASSTAHPIYQKKGDEVGGISLNEHEASPSAHRLYYLRRMELAYELAHYVEHNTDYPMYIGPNPTAIDTQIPAVVTTRLLHLIFDNPKDIIKGIFTWDAIVVAYNRKTGEKTNATSGDGLEVASWDLFKELDEFAHTLISTDASINPLLRDKIVAAYNHTHEGQYAEKGHTHRDWNDLRNNDGVLPARADHNHDGVYWRKDEDISGEFNDQLKWLGYVGIYPNSLLYFPYSDHQEEDVHDERPVIASGKMSLDRRVVQGHTSYVFQENFVDKFIAGGAPADIKTQITKTQVDCSEKFIYSTDNTSTVTSSRSIDFMATLSVITGKPLEMDAQIEPLNTLIATNPTSSVVRQSVTQLLEFGSAVKAFSRNPTTVADAVKNYKNGAYQIYWRQGYSLETAWYIESILSACLGLSAQDFFEIIDEGADRIKTIADLFTKAFDTAVDRYGSDPLAATLAPGLVFGFFHPNSSDRVRTSMQLWQAKRSVSDVIGRIVSIGVQQVTLHDLCKWVVPGTTTVVTAAIDQANTTAYTKNDSLLLTTTHTQFMPHYTYYTYGLTWMSVVGDDVDEVNSYFLREGSEYIPFDPKANISQDTCKNCQTATPNKPYIDDKSIIRHEFRRVVDSDEIFYAGSRYFRMKDGTNVYGNKDFEELVPGTDYIIGAKIETVGFDVYRWIRLTPNDVSMWSKKPVRRATTASTVTDPAADTLDNSAIYYEYSVDDHKFEVVGIGSSLPQRSDHKVPGPADGYKNPLFIDYPIFYRTTRSTKVLPSDTTIVPLTQAIKFVDGVEYIKYLNEDGDATNVIDVQLVDEIPTIIPSSTCYVKRGSINDKLTGKYYGVRIPTYPRNLYDSDTTLYCGSFFIETRDKLRVTNKTYYTSDGLMFTPYTGDLADDITYYEKLDLERFYDFWCAIQQLTTTGSDVQTSGLQPIVYKFGENGSLITWDEWKRFITDGDAVLKDLQGAKHTHANKSVIDMFSYTGGELFFGTTKVATSSSNHSHANKTVLDRLTEQSETKASGGEIVRALFDSHRVAYMDDMQDYIDLFESARPGLNAVMRLSFASDNHLVVDGTHKIPFLNDIHTHANKSILDSITSDVLTNTHFHLNQPNVLDELGVTGDGALTFRGNEIGHVASMYKIPIVKDVSYETLIDKGSASFTLAQINTIAGKTAFHSFAELKTCGIQFVLTLSNTAESKTFSDTGPIGLYRFPGGDGTHLSAIFDDQTESIKIGLPIDYYSSIGSDKMRSVSETVEEIGSANAKFSLEMVLTVAGSLGTGDGQYFENYELLKNIFRDTSGHLYYSDEDHRLVYLSDITASLISSLGLGYVKSEDLGEFAYLDKPGNWTELVNLVYDETTKHFSYGTERFAYLSDVNSLYENDALLRSLAYNSNGRLTYQIISGGGNAPSTKEVALLTDLSTLMPASINNIEFTGSNSGNINGGFIDFHYNKSTADYTSRIIEQTSGVLLVSGGLNVGVNLGVSGNAAISGSMTVGGKTIAAMAFLSQPTWWSAAGATTWDVVKTLALNAEGKLTFKDKSGNVVVVGTDSAAPKVESFGIESASTPTYTENGITYWRLDAAGTDNTYNGYTYSMTIGNTASGKPAMPNPVANIAASADVNPIYVPGNSLIFINSAGYLCVRVPLEFLNIHGIPGSLIAHLRILRTKISI